MNAENWAVYRDCYGIHDAFPDLGQTAHLRGKIVSERLEGSLSREKAERLARQYNNTLKEASLTDGSL